MFRRIRHRFGGKKVVDRWDDDLGSSEDEEEGGATLVTVDDGKGGIKHINVDRVTDSQSEIIRPPSDGHSMVDGVSTGSSAMFKVHSNQSTIQSTLSMQSTESHRPTLGDLLKKELKGKQIFNIEPHSEKLRRRMVSKSGLIHIGKTKVSKRRRRYLSDYFNTMLDIKWRYVLFIFSMSFFVSWFVFALVWYAIILNHGDLEEQHLPSKQEASGWTPCVWQIKNFASVFLFSVETQHTIGYGGRQTTEECPEAIFLMTFQSVVGVMIQACMVGIIFSKLSRPKKRSPTLIFSKNAVVCQRDGTNCLLFRVGNMRYSQLVEAHVRAILISKKVTHEGEVIPYYQTELQVGTDLDGEEDNLFFIWPTTIVHKIGPESPFYSMSARDFLKKRYELVVILEGIVEPTGMTIQARSSYLPNEILWGYRFVNLLYFKRSASEYKVDYSAFNAVYKVDISTRSQKSKDEDSEEEDTEDSHAPLTPSTRNSPPPLKDSNNFGLRQNHSCGSFASYHTLVSPPDTPLSLNAMTLPLSGLPNMKPNQVKQSSQTKSSIQTPKNQTKLITESDQNSPNHHKSNHQNVPNPLQGKTELNCPVKLETEIFNNYTGVLHMV